jgi:hypothetical protein
MHRSFVLTALLAVIGLLLAGPQKASAQTIFACVNPTTGLIQVVAQNATCPPNWNKISWNATSSSSSPGTNLLFPYVTTAPGFETGIAISNTSQDSFGTTTQSGTCTVSFFQAGVGGTNPANFTTPTIPAGTTFSFLASAANHAGSNFTGYIIAACNFSFAHGYAAVTDVGASGVFSSYLALIMQTPRVSGENLNN